MNTKLYWNRSHKNHLNLEKPSNYAVKVEKLFPINSNILELGGGKGNDSLYFLSKTHIPHIIDISSITKESLLKQTDKIEYIVSDFSTTPYPFQDSSFDIVYSRLALQYFKPFQMIKIFTEINRILKPLGKAYISIKSANDKDEMESIKSNSEEIESGVFLAEGIIKSRYTHEQLKTFLKESNVINYEIIEIEEDLGITNKHGHSDLKLTEIVLTKTS